MEADFLRFYGVDLLDFWRGSLSPRRVLVLVRGLPLDSAYAREALGEDALWGLPEHLLALAVDHLAIGSWQRANAGLKKNEQSPPPKPIPRPGARKEKPKMTRDVAERLMALGPGN